MLAHSIKILFIAAGATLLPSTKGGCDFEEDHECRAVDGCECVADDCEEPDPLPHPG